MLIGVDGNEANIKNRVGSNQYAFELLQALWKLDKKHDWLIYLRKKPLVDMPRKRKGWHYRIFGPSRFWTQWRLPLDLYIHEPRPDVFFTPGHYAPRWCPVPLVISIMDLGYLHFPEQFTKPIYYQLKNWTERSIKKATHILAISESTKNDIIKEYKIPREKITVTYPGIKKAPNTKHQTPNIKKKYGIKGEYILFLGTLKPSKNIEGLLEAFAKLKKDQVLNLVIAGKKGWMYEKIFEKVKKLNLEDRVIFTDFVPEDDLPALMAGAKVFVIPSFWEGFGIPVLEAMAVGTPVVVSNVASLPEVVGDAGVLVDPDDIEDIARGIKKVLEDNSLYNRLKRKGFERVKEFSWQKCAKQTLGVLENVATK